MAGVMGYAAGGLPRYRAPPARGPGAPKGGRAAAGPRDGPDQPYRRAAGALGRVVLRTAFEAIGPRHLHRPRADPGRGRQHSGGHCLIASGLLGRCVGLRAARCARWSYCSRAEQPRTAAPCASSTACILGGVDAAASTGHAGGAGRAPWPTRQWRRGPLCLRSTRVALPARLATLQRETSPRLLYRAPSWVPTERLLSDRGVPTVVCGVVA